MKKIKTAVVRAAKASSPKSLATRITATKTRVFKASGVKPGVIKVSPATSMEAHQGVLHKVSQGAEMPIENAAALVPFFEQLYRHQKGEMPGPIHVLHYGDSHTASDELTGSLREQFQQAFGDGGPGFSYAGSPWKSYRRLDLRSGSTRGWYSDGLMGRSGDGRYGLGGVSMSAKHAHESVYLLAEGQKFELFYLQQPDGGTVEILDNGNVVGQFSTAGEMGPGYFHYETEAGQHRLDVETMDGSPVRLFGWVAEKATGITYETLGINGAEAPMILGWDEDVLLANVARRNPALIVLAYGTNEAGHKDLTLEAYRDSLTALIARFRKAAPAATILLLGPPDRAIRVRNFGWVPMDDVDKIVEAQRQAAAMTGSAFWDQRAKMGGKGAMRQWVQAGMAQADYVHFTVPGYKMLGEAIYRDLMGQYEIFLKARNAVAVVESVPASNTPR